MGGYKQPYSGVNRGGEKYDSPLPEASDSLTFNERRLDSARTTIHVADTFGDRNTDAGQGMAKHPFNTNGLGMKNVHMPENRPQTDGTTYPNVISITARNPHIKSGGQLYA